MSVEEITDSIKDSNIQNQQNENIINKGTGAGGSNTNKNGLNYEEPKDLSTEYIIVEKTNSHMKVVFKKYPDKVFITGKKSQFMKYLSKQENKDVSPNVMEQNNQIVGLLLEIMYTLLNLNFNKVVVQFVKSFKLAIKN